MKRCARFLLILSFIIVINSTSYGVAFEYECNWTSTSSGTEFKIEFDSTHECGTSSSWKGYKKINGVWAEHNDSESYGQINLSEFPCCGLAV